MKKVTKLEYTDPSALAVDPRDPAHVMVASAKTGVYEFQDGKFVKLWNNKNSMLQTSIAYNSNYVVCCGITYDNEGNLWMTNGYLTSTPNKRILVEYTKDGEWVDHSESFAEIGTAEYPLLRNLKSAFFDSRGLLWFVNDHFSCPALFCYNKQTNKLTAWKTFINQDGTEFSIGDGVHCVTEDKEGNIWVGTSLGTVMLTADEIMRGGSTFTQVKVPRNDGSNLADYLLSGTDISGIYVDDANRKWFATYKQGVYVISDDNIEEVYHFTTKNSELVSDVVESIAMNKETGEIFFGTDHGLCSYMTDAMKSYDEMESDNVYAFPNPVRPDYTGLITITGLTMNADIKIVTSSGQLVAQGRSTGGAFTWDGCDLDGQRVATGVYMVMTATSEGKKGVVCKIAVVN
jgi:streptogramin lyase